jgi:predicted nucleic acid-binding protein
MGKYLIDNNVISHYFSSFYTENGMNFIGEILDKTPNISVITEIEALSWINPNPQKENIVKNFISDSVIIQLNPEIVKKCIEIRRTNKIKTPDAIIAATAIIYKYILISSDKGFENIKGLKVLNPIEIYNN